MRQLFFVTHADVCIDPDENDRSSTGFLPPDEFEQVADQFFAQPDCAVRGRETARDAQERVYRAVREIVGHEATKQCDGDIAIISHGGVWTLLLCKPCGYMISRQYDQPWRGGGNYFVIDAETLRVVQSWQSIDAWGV